MKKLLLTMLLATGFCAPATAQPYVVANRLFPEKLKIMGISGLDPDGCPSGSANCSNIVIRGIIERIGYVDGADFPNMLRIKDEMTGHRYSINFPYKIIWDSIGTADTSWIGLWLHQGDRVVIIGTIGGSSGNISIDSIYLARFLDGQIKKHK